MIKQFFSNVYEGIKHYSNYLWELSKKQLIKIYLNKKHLIWKISIILICAFIVLLTSFLTRNSILNATQSYWELIPGFLVINITGNTGVSFGTLGDSNPSLVYFVQSIPIVLGFFVLLFSSNYLLDIGVSLVFFGGLSNIIDRSIVDNYKYLSGISTNNAVVDYFQFPFIKNSAIFNFPDTFVIIGMIFVGIQIIISFVKDYKKEKDSEENKKPIKDVVLDEERNKTKKEPIKKPIVIQKS
ncbi:lipoprotein signal peptidase [Malacoplasma penetrans]|uniref:Lipoprotein signal peptidase n=1 Tax=Malacoplasma penetrans (strain HF-2) TaxID=272633 RepID=LSPA_MALP2|nr:lipoprotein signal peptidase [Malacoplasma penetrans]Q8EWS0.1 RecName: Full=Lipoprotein signal peptidase; AltName: Full=Prolipoprotein signal peptidase; AltName: Full=Signal peptidase II; Short=SPase II [Malacoplasma penetrans HF-2]RXY97013.1 lipoprotein signal peptidase [Malacoplasma penetrans]BAC43924.1 prolipoprotein signal peptidase [Malacoplasma penetrans HF-2]